MSVGCTKFAARPALALLLLLLLLLCAGCPGWPAPPVERKTYPSERHEDNEFYISERGGWISLNTFTASGRGKAGQVLESPWITMDLEGKIELGKPVVLLEVGTDASRLATMPTDGCFEGLVTDELVPLSAVGPPNRGCKEEGYGMFRYCPSHPAYRLPLYLAAYSLEGPRGRVAAQRRVISVAQVLNRETRPEPLGVICNNKRQGAAAIPVPYALCAGDYLRVRARIKLIVDAREATGEQNEITYLRAKAINK